ncbi:MAG: MBL fold metallo-hydrolase [Actinomycetia bacterium]|nr:MBL fold metallo-hydrolase [Actinomycetes bacterium]
MSSGATDLRVTLLGSGSPTPSLERCHPAALVQWGESGAVLVDAGDGVVSQLLESGTALGSVAHVALTHMHWDHILGYPGFVWGSWIGGRTALHTWGPAGTVEMHEHLVESYYRDQAEWAIDIGFAPEGWHDMAVTDVEPGWSTELDGCVISAGAVVHPPMEAVAFRFNYGGRSLVISGDTAACAELVAFSESADLLVVDACAATPPVSASPARRALIERLHGFHASPQDCVDMAKRAHVGHVVLTHHLPDAQPMFEASGYDGRITVGDDLATFVA